MGGRNNRRSYGNGIINGGDGSNSRGRGKGRGRGRGGVSFAIKEAPFVDGGVLSYWQLKTPSPPKPSSRGGQRNWSGSKGGRIEGHGGEVSQIVCRGANVGGNRTLNALRVGSLDGSGSSGSKMVRTKGNGRAHGYQCPSLELQQMCRGRSVSFFSCGSMGGRNNRRSYGNGIINGGDGSNSRGRGKGRGRGRGGVSFAIKEAPFVDGGVLSYWQLKTPSPPKPSSRGGQRNWSGSKGGRIEGHGGEVSQIVCRGANVGGNRTSNALEVGSLDGSGSSGSKMVRTKGNGRAYGYQYPSLELQEGFLQETSVEVNGECEVGNSQDFSLCGLKETKITVYEDEMPPSISPVPYAAYDCSYNFVLGDSSHRGLGFEEDVVVGDTSSEQMALIGETEFDRSDTDVPRDTGKGSGGVCGLKMEESLPKKLSSKNDPAFLSIGDIKLYTEDISDDEDDDECSNEESLESEMSDGEASIQSSESDDSEDIFDSSSSIDDDVVADYLEGVGGCDTLLDAATWLVEGISDDSNDSSRDDITNAMKKLGGIALREASMEYGMQKNFRSSLKDSGPLFSEKIRHSQFPQSWPSKSQSKMPRNYPGAKKKLRKESIAAKRRNRMMLRGVDIQQVNTKLEQLVLDGVDVYSFQPMHPRDCSQVQRLAAIYRLRSSSQGSGKKRFVSVARSHHTSLPSSNDKVRLEKLLGPGDDVDYPVVDVGHTKSRGGRKQTKRTPRGSYSRPQERTLGSRRISSKNLANRSSGGETSEGRGKKKAPLANKPVSFISSGVMQSETATEETLPASREGKNVNREECRSACTSEKFAAFEVHTKGFGSKMMAKMGFVEGKGLGRDGGGMAAPIQVIQRPRSLGLGMNF